MANNSFETQILKASELSLVDENIWRAMCAEHPLFRSPILSPEFFRAVAQVRDDVFVAIIRQDNLPIAFLAHHRRPNNFARPAGAPFADYSALITWPNPPIKMQEALKLIGIDRFQAIGLVDPYGVCGEIGGQEDDAFGIDFTIDGPPNSAGKKQRKNVNRLRRHVAEELGETRFIFDDRNIEHYSKMIAFKRAQTRQTGIHDFLSPPWVVNLMDNLFNADRSGLHGCMLSLMAGETPVAMHYGLKLGDRMHPWIATFDPKYFKYSPGQIFLMDCPNPLAEQKIAYYDLSTGHQHYKSTFTNNSFKVRNVTINAQDIAPKAEPKSQLALRLHRRLDQIACLELDNIGRAKGIIFAFLSMTNRISAKSKTQNEDENQSD